MQTSCGLHNHCEAQGRDLHSTAVWLCERVVTPSRIGENTTQACSNKSLDISGEISEEFIISTSRVQLITTNVDLEVRRGEEPGPTSLHAFFNLPLVTGHVL